MLKLSSGVITCSEIITFLEVIVSLAEIACSTRSTYIKSASTKDISTDITYAKSVYIRVVFDESTCIGSTGTGYAWIKGTFVRDTYIKDASIDDSYDSAHKSRESSIWCSIFNVLGGCYLRLWVILDKVP